MIHHTETTDSPAISMGALGLWKCFFTFFICFTFILCASGSAFSRPPRGGGGGQISPELKGKFTEFRELVEEKRRDGTDISEAMDLAMRSREEARSGNMQKAAELIDQAIALLKGSGAVQSHGETESSAESSFDDEVKEHRRGAEGTVELKVDSGYVVVTTSVAGVERGRWVEGAKEPFPSTTMKADGGKVKLKVSTVPLFVEDGKGGWGSWDYVGSPFGGHPTAISKTFDKNYSDIGVKWIRYPGLFMAWDIVEKTKGTLDWSVTDTVVSETRRNRINVLLTVKSFNRWDQGQVAPQRGKLMEPRAPRDMQGFLSFLAKAVERYDGDGVDDAAGSPAVNYWQIENEVDGFFWGDTAENYARLLHASYKAVKEANPGAKVLIAGASTPAGFNSFYPDVLRALKGMGKGPSFDIFDIHWYGHAGEYDEIGGYKLTVFMKELRSKLSEYGYGSVPVWITETGTHGGKGVVGKGGRKLPEQDEVAQAMELVKRYVYFIGNGVQKVFWYQMVEKHHEGAGIKNDYFENVGLVNNPKNDGDSSKKLAFYSYRLMVGMLEGSDWEKTERLDLGPGIHAYRFFQDGKKVYVIWHD